jgi:hypothetical protein
MVDLIFLWGGWWLVVREGQLEICLRIPAAPKPFANFDPTSLVPVLPHKQPAGSMSGVVGELVRAHPEQVVPRLGDDMQPKASEDQGTADSIDLLSAWVADQSDKLSSVRSLQIRSSQPRPVPVDIEHKKKSSGHRVSNFCRCRAMNETETWITLTFSKAHRSLR